MRGARGVDLIRVLAPFLGVVLVLAVFGTWTLAQNGWDLAADPFLSLANLRTVATQTVTVGLCTLGMTLVIVSGGIDLSVGSNIALACVVTAVALQGGASPALAAAAGALAGAALGLLNGLLVTGLKIVPFIVTLGTLGIARGAAKWLGREETVHVDPDRLHWLAGVMQRAPDPPWLLLAPGLWLLIALAVVMALVLRRTVLGVWTVAIGSNESTARLCGVPVERVRVVLYLLGGLFAGFAGVTQFSRLTVGDPTTSVGAELDVIAAVVIGGGSLNGGEGSISGSLVGALLMSLRRPAGDPRPSRDPPRSDTGGSSVRAPAGGPIRAWGIRVDAEQDLRRAEGDRGAAVAARRRHGDPPDHPERELLGRRAREGDPVRSGADRAPAADRELRAGGRRAAVHDDQGRDHAPRAALGAQRRARLQPGLGAPHGRL
jgi:ribose transport system permease protein